ncbi:MAG: CDP-alcohol phosphatidyltransferase family protein [Acidimicrobiales bacterium]
MSTSMFDGNFRTAFDKGMVPIGQSLQKAGVSANAVTAAGVAMAAGCAVAIGLGNFPVAVLMLLLTGLPDALDGAVAKAAGGESGPRGAFLDSTSDCLADGLFAGAGWYLSRPTTCAWQCCRSLSTSPHRWLTSGPRPNRFGYDAKGGIMERAERFIVLGFGLLFSPVRRNALGDARTSPPSRRHAWFVSLASGQHRPPRSNHHPDGAGLTRRRQPVRPESFVERAKARARIPSTSPPLAPGAFHVGLAGSS